MNLEEIRNLVVEEIKAVNALILSSLHSHIERIEQIGHYIINSGGKRLRPLIVLLGALAANNQGKQHINLAAIIEFIHTATLLHDDVVDESTLRRGNQTANAVWGDHTSVLVGDFLYSRAFQMMVEIGNMDVMQLMANTTNIISEGEVLQLLNTHNPHTSEADYLEVIKCKTAILFAAAAQLGATVNDAPETIKQALYDYGLNLGIAYQLVDDVLDYSSSAEELGKNIGDDLAEGKPTLPLIYIMQQGNPQQVDLVSEAICEGKVENIQQIHAAITNTGAIEYVQNKLDTYTEKAINSLKPLADSAYKTALINLALSIKNRTH